MKHYLFVNKDGRKFKTTLTGKAATLKNPKLNKTCKLLGECNERGQLLNAGGELLTEKTVQTLKEIMTTKVNPEVKFQEPKQNEEQEQKRRGRPAKK